MFYRVFYTYDELYYEDFTSATMMMMIVLIAASERQIPVRCNGQITDDDTREVKSSLEK